MALITKNIFMEERYNLLKEYEKTKDNTLLPKIEELDKKAKELTQQQLGEIQDKVETIREEVKVDTTLSRSKQYKELIRLFRETVKLKHEISDIKKQMREEKKNG